MGVWCRGCCRLRVRVRWWGRLVGCLGVCGMILVWVWGMWVFLCFRVLCLRIVLWLWVLVVRGCWGVWVRLRVVVLRLVWCGVVRVVLVGLCLCFLVRVRSGRGWLLGCWIVLVCSLSRFGGASGRFRSLWIGRLRVC